MRSSMTNESVALDDGERRWTFEQLDEQVHSLATQLKARGMRVMATLMDNSAAWVIADRAAAEAGVVHVPLPAFFTAEQIGHAIGASGVDALLTLPSMASRWPQAPSSPWIIGARQLTMLRLPARKVALPTGTAKITFTSGTTGRPKGVCLDSRTLQIVARGLVEATEPIDIRRHFCALPFAVLLENVAGVIAPLMRGATCVTLPLSHIGLAGSSSFDAAPFHLAIMAQQPHSVILLPQMLRIWVDYLLRTGQRAPTSLKLAAVGGAAVGAKLLHAARSVGVPAFEGYGLSECASVQTLNLPGAELPGSAGRVLPHASIRVAADGELEVRGSLFLGYLGQLDADTAPSSEWWPSGDLGRIDADGFVHVEGRKKHLLITAFGRNVSPEWVETALRGEDAIAQAVVFGDGEPSLSAVLWPVASDAPDEALQAAVDAANATLPDYARIVRWQRADAEFCVASGMATANGRPQRSAILQLHADKLGLSGGPISS